ncbi:MAG: hypothetical protein E6249_03150 [Peptoniphilus grossensis]|uniref:hypothetical protein n=1 Tax=Peptoniphilus grossensis TaxID=1465756 RepID=UPI00259014CB|nr:hypothetical protein [Peptoniphilus grossensis]MDU5099448.1 hypothetical protein [Peptoniphilus grossensis]
MEKNIPKKFLDFDDNIDGQFTSEKNTTPALDMKSIIKYCRENNIDPEKLTEKQIEGFCLAKSL